jgi:hypothetical protein
MAFSTPDTLVTNDVITLARYNKLKDSIIANSFAQYFVGGSETIAIATGLGYVNAPNYDGDPEAAELHGQHRCCGGRGWHRDRSRDVSNADVHARGQQGIPAHGEQVGRSLSVLGDGLDSEDTCVKRY